MKYEMMLVMKPIDDKKVEAIIEGVTSYINNYGTLIKVDNWGRKLLAYEIQGEYMFCLHLIVSSRIQLSST